MNAQFWFWSSSFCPNDRTEIHKRLRNGEMSLKHYVLLLLCLSLHSESQVLWTGTNGGNHKRAETQSSCYLSGCCQALNELEKMGMGPGQKSSCMEITYHKTVCNMTCWIRWFKVVRPNLSINCNWPLASQLRFLLLFQNYFY